MADNSKIRVKIEGDVKDVSKITKGLQSIDKNAKAADKTGKSFSTSLKGVGVAAGAAAVAAAAAAVAIYKMASSTAKVIDDTNKMSQALGISTDYWSRMNHVARLNGTSMDELAVGMKRLAKSAYDSAAGAKKQKEIFEQLNVNVKDSNGNFKTMEELTQETMEALGGMSDQTKKVAFAQELFGRAGNKLIPILNNGSEAIKQQMKDADDLGVVFNDRAKTAAASFNDQLFRMQQAFTGLKAKISLPFMEGLAAAFQGVAEGMKLSGGFFKSGATDAEKLTETVKGTAKILVFATSSFKRLGMQAALAFDTVVSAVAIAIARVKEFGTDTTKNTSKAAKSTLRSWEALKKYFTVKDPILGNYNPELLSEMEKGYKSMTKAEQVAFAESIKNKDMTKEAAAIALQSVGVQKKASDIIAKEWEARRAEMQKGLDQLTDDTAAALVAINNLTFTPSTTPTGTGGDPEPTGSSEEDTSKKLNAMNELLRMAQETSIAIMRDSTAQKIAIVDKEYDERLAKIIELAEESGATEEQLTKWFEDEFTRRNDRIYEINQEAFERRQEQLRTQAEAEKAHIDQVTSYITEAMGYVSSISSNLHTLQLNQIDEETEKKKAQAKATITNQKSLDKRLAEIDKEAEKKREEAAKREQRINLVMAIVNTAVAVTKALSSMSPPVNFVMAALTAAAGAIEIATIASQAFAKGGVVKGQGGTDSETVRATPGEMVLTPGQQRNLFDIAQGTSRSARGSMNVSVGGDTIIIQGNAGPETVEAIRQTRQEQLYQLREQLIELKALGQGVS